MEPAESTREAEYIARNIKATRAAMGLDKVAVKPFAYDESLSAEALQNNVETIRNVRLWDPLILRRTYQRLQEVRTFYRFTDVDIDRYMVEGRLSHALKRARGEVTNDDATLFLLEWRGGFLLEWRGGSADHLAQLNA